MTELLMAGGESLSIEDSEAITADEDTHVVLLAGPHSCGKTTLIAAIYDMFFDGPVNSYNFAGSRTLPGFERRAFLARTVSDSPAPGAERTSLAEQNRFLHLRVCFGVSGEETVQQAVSPVVESGRERVNPAIEAERESIEEPSREPVVSRLGGNERFRNLLVADWSGEIFERLLNSREYAQTQDVLKACHHFAVLLDCERILDQSDRHKVLAEANVLIRSCLDSGIMKDGISCSVILSKWDLLRPRSAARRFVTEAQSQLENLFASRFGELRVFRTAAVTRSPNPAVPEGFGLRELLRFWVEYDMPLPDVGSSNPSS